MDIFEALVNHHEEMLDLIDAVKEDPARYNELNTHLNVHHALEEDILYRRMQDKGGEAWAEATEMMEEHQVLEFQLLTLGNFPRTSERWPVKLHVLEEYLEHHFEEEQDDVFDEGAEAIEQTEADEMGRKFEDKKRERLECLG